MRILIAGDYVPRNRLAQLVESGDYSTIFKEIKKVVSSSDYSIVNFESPIVEEDDKPIFKCGPNLRCSAEAVDAIKYAGFKCATLANNHIRDWGNRSVLRTINILKEKGLDYVGAGENIIAASNSLYVKVGENKIAIVNCCENEFSIAANNQFGANPLNPVKQYYAIKEAKEKADYVIVIVHGGHEHHQLPSPRMQDTYRFFVDAGADLVVNHHQHCFSGYELYKGKYIVYGTGNFCMDKDPIRVGQLWNYGYMVLWDTDKPSGIELIPYEQCGLKPTVHLLEKNAFDERMKELNSIIADRMRLETETCKYYADSEKQIRLVIEPLRNRIILALQHRNLLPSFVSRKWLVRLHNFVLCEAHRDKMEYYFKNKNK